MEQIVAQRHDLERLIREITDQAQQQINNGKTLIRLNDFCYRVRAGLDNNDLRRPTALPTARGRCHCRGGRLHKGEDYHTAGARRYIA